MSDATHRITTGPIAKAQYMENVHIAGRPQTTDHNISDDFVKHPPHNRDLSDSIAEKVSNRDIGKLQKQGSKYPQIVRNEKEVLGLNESLGRETKEEGLASIVFDDSGI